jgi:hypothetical protein
MGEWANGRMGEWANGRMGEWAMRRVWDAPCPEGTKGLSLGF